MDGRKCGMPRGEQRSWQELLDAGAVGEDDNLFFSGDGVEWGVLDGDGNSVSRSALGFFDQHGGQCLLVEGLILGDDQAGDSGLGECWQGEQQEKAELESQGLLARITGSELIVSGPYGHFLRHYHI